MYYTDLTDFPKKGEFCYEYWLSMYNQTLYRALISISVVIINTLLRSIGSKLIQTIGHYYKDEEITDIMTLLFVTQYINTGILLVIASANFENTPLWFIPIRNSYSDFSSEWFLNVGVEIQQAMVI